MKPDIRTIVLSGITALIVSLVAIGIATTSPRWSTTSQSTSSLPSSVATQLEHLEREEGSVVETVKLAEPAVASVIISKDVPVLERYMEEVPLNDPFGGDFFNFSIPRVRQNGTQLQEIGGGTAFFISADGMMMTNKHVVNDEKAEYTVFLNDGRKLSAKVLARDPSNDIALLKVEGGPFPYLSLSANDEPLLGQTAIAIGNALGEYSNTVSVGVISGLRRTITAGDRTGMTEQLSRIIQTDAAINQGNSGGPLVSTSGDVIGMSTAIAGNAQGIAFAIPAGDLRRVLESYQQYGRIVRPYMGVRYVPVTQELKDQLKLSYDYGVIASGGGTPTEPAIVPGSPANKAGLKENDVILEIDGQKLQGTMGLAELVAKKKPGDTVSVKYARNGKEQTINVTLEERKE